MANFRIIYIIELELLLLLHVHRFNVAAGKDGTNFSYFIYWVACEFFPQGSIKFDLHL